MNKRSSSLPVVVLVAVVALVLGSLGTAVAGPALTSGKVKKIAAKVVKKKAPKLSVASAGNATNLAGKPASSYLNSATVYTSTTAVAATVHAITLPLAPGNYTIGYSVFMFGGSGYSFCQVRRVRGAVTLNVADDTVDTTGGPSTSGYGALDVIAGDDVSLRCNSANPFTITSSQPAQIVVTPLDSITAPAPLAAARGTAGRGN